MAVFGCCCPQPQLFDPDTLSQFRLDASVPSIQLQPSVTLVLLELWKQPIQYLPPNTVDSSCCKPFAMSLGLTVIGWEPGIQLLLAAEKLKEGRGEIAKQEPLVPAFSLNQGTQVESGQVKEGA